MHRRHLLGLLAGYAARFPDERESAEVIRRFVEAHPDCFERSCREGHITGSAWIASPDGSLALLVRHRKLGAWLQPGGHADGDPDPAAVALREAVEESGLTSVAHADWRRDGSAGPQPFDLDTHRIPARGEEPAHLHFDLRYLLVGDPGEAARPSSESDDARWVRCADIAALHDEPSLLRMAAKAARLLGGPVGGYNGGVSTLRSVLEAKLRDALAPEHLEILDESGRHAVPAGSESHFRLRVVARAFEGQRLVERHRTINRMLEAELAGGIHALALETLTPEEWEARGGACQESPPCLGGDGTTPK